MDDALIVIACSRSHAGTHSLRGLIQGEHGEGSQWRLAENKAGGGLAASRLFAARHRGEHEARLCIQCCLPGPIGEAGPLCARQVKANGS